VTKRRDRRAALKFLKRTMKRYGRSRSIVTDRLRSYRSAMKVIGNSVDQECGRWHCQSKYVYFAKTSELDFAAIDFPAFFRVDLSGSMAAPSI